MSGCGAATRPAAQQSQRHAVDAAFIQRMLPHDAQAIEAAELARKRAVHQPLRRLAQAVVYREMSELNVMRGTGRRLPATRRASLGLPAWKMRSALDVRSLRRSHSFDRTFADELLADDDAAIHMAGAEAFYGRNAALRRFAARVIHQRAREIERVERWMKRWGMY